MRGCGFGWAKAAFAMSSVCSMLPNSTISLISCDPLTRWPGIFTISGCKTFPRTRFCVSSVRQTALACSAHDAQWRFNGLTAHHSEVLSLWKDFHDVFYTVHFWIWAYHATDSTNPIADPSCLTAVHHRSSLLETCPLLDFATLKLMDMKDMKPLKSGHLRSTKCLGPSCQRCRQGSRRSQRRIGWEGLWSARPEPPKKFEVMLKCHQSMFFWSMKSWWLKGPFSFSSV